MRALMLGLAFWAGTASAQTADRQPAEALPTAPLVYTVFTAVGDTAALGDVVAAMRDADVVFLGEMHNDSTAHILQLRLFEAAGTLDRPVALGLEMFERDVQLVLDEYLAGLTRERDFLAAARPWGNYATDYRPLVEHARERGLPVLATNAPARYVSRTSRLGPDSLAVLSDAATATLPPLPVAPASDTLGAKFTALMADMVGHGHGAPSGADSTEATTAPAADSVAAPPAHGTMPSMDHLLAAQNLRDAAMAWSVAEHLATQPGALVVHVNGSFHSEEGLGIPEHLARYRPGTRVLVVTLRPGALGSLAGNDFVIRTGDAAEAGE